MESKRLRRSTNTMVAGVCAGLAEYLEIDPTFVRLAFVGLLLAGGHGLLVYIVLWIVMPPATAIESVSRSTTGASMAKS